MAYTLKQKLSQGHLALGLTNFFPAPGIIECMAKDADWIWIDGQHGQFAYDNLLNAVRTANAMGVAPIPRVPGHEYGIIGPVLDTDPAGIMVPMVDTAEQARNVVNAVHYPPLGCRSYGGRRVFDLHGPDYVHMARKDLLLVCQIETPQAVENAEAIAATEGVDLLFFGPDDVKLRLNLPLTATIDTSPELVQAMEKTAQAAKNAGKLLGCPAGTPKALKLAQSLGYQLIGCGSDTSFLRTAGPAKLNELRQASKA